MSDGWRRKIGEAVERLRTRYDHIGRKTGGPFLALVYPPEVEPAVLREWHTQAGALAPELEVVPVDVLAVTQQILDEFGIEQVVFAFQNPMPGSDPIQELAHRWVHAVAEAVRSAARAETGRRRVVSLERLAALHPVAGPRDVLQQLWDSSQSSLLCPVVALVPGSLRGARTYAFVDERQELMYRGDLL